LIFAPQGGPDRYADTRVIGLPAIPFWLYPEARLMSPWVDVRSRLAEFKPDVVHLVNPVTLGLAGLRAAQQLKFPVVASYQTDIPGFAQRWGLGVFSGMLRLYLRWLHNQANLNLTPSRITQAELERHGFRRVKVWSRGVDAARYQPARRSEQWRARLSDGRPDAPLLLYVGRVAAEKRIEWLRPVLDALPQARLAIVGDGPSRSLLTHVFSGTPTVFTGYLRGDDLANAYAAADVFVFPAANETLGNVVLEAMASGLPVVAPRSGGLLDHVVDGQNGLLFEPEDQASLVTRVGQLVDEPAFARRLGQAGRQYAQARSWTGTLDDLMQDYARVAHLGSSKDKTKLQASLKRREPSGVAY
jgi:glycosyltransferase involved in cell wall biosynthesis